MPLIYIIEYSTPSNLKASSDKGINTSSLGGSGVLGPPGGVGEKTVTLDYNGDYKWIPLKQCKSYAEKY